MGPGTVIFHDKLFCGTALKNKQTIQLILIKCKDRNGKSKKYTYFEKWQTAEHIVGL